MAARRHRGRALSINDIHPLIARIKGEMNRQISTDIRLFQTAICSRYSNGIRLTTHFANQMRHWLLLRRFGLFSMRANVVD